MIKAIFFDNDGTILSHESKSVPASTRIALQKLKEQGIKIIMATGRSMQELLELEGSDIAYDAYLVNNGQVCLNEKQELLFAYPIHKEDEQLLVDLFHQKQFPIVFVEEKRIYTNMINEHIETALNAVSTSVPIIDEYHGDELLQAVVYFDQDYEHEFRNLLKHSKMTMWHPFGRDVYSIEGGKLASMKRYMQMFGIKDDEVMAFGDGENDMEMLQHAYIGVAMGNASDEVKAISNYITTDIDDNGILNALKHYGILK